MNLFVYIFADFNIMVWKRNMKTGECECFIERTIFYMVNKYTTCIQ